MALRSLVIISALLSAVVAQSTSSNPLIPSGVSSACNDYLQSLDKDPNFEACTSPFTSALSQYTPGSGTTPTSAGIASTLSSLCQSDTSSSCPQSTITTQLSKFYSACSAELTTTPNNQVKAIYDALYILRPFGQAICSKDDAGNYCATKLSNTSSAGSVALVDPEKSQRQTTLQHYLYTSPDSQITARDSSNSTPVVIPNTTTFGSTNILFLFLDASEPASVLCTTCTRNILTPYLTFESMIPYALGIPNSLLLAGQVALYKGVTTECGQSFLSGNAAAAGLSSGLFSGAAPLAIGQELSAAVGAIVAVAAFVAASL